jgi:hypothetical protein
MANNQNLKPPINKRPTSEARKISRKGGIKSGEVRREKKKLREQLEIAIDILTRQQLKKGKLTKEQIELIKATDINIYDLITIANNPKVKPETRLRAKETIFDRLYGKPKQEIEGSGQLDINKIVFEVIK